MHKDELIASLRADAAAFSAAAATGLTADVPSCPGWTVESLTNHLGRVHRWFTASVRTGTTEQLPFPKRPAEVSVGWFDEGAAELATALEDSEPDRPAWNWSGTNLTVRWITRRVAQETAVHRWDCQLASGRPDPIDTELALDGVDEVLDVFFPASLNELDAETRAAADLGGSIHLHATDSPHGEWLIRLDKGELLVGHGHEKGDVAVRATASDLLLYMWGRYDYTDADRFETFGDTAVLDRMRGLKLVGD